LLSYQALEVSEVWFWEDGMLDVYVLESEGYHKVSQSQIPVLAPIDLAIMAECILMGETSRLEAVRRFLLMYGAD
jgi:hypothetical protein